MERLTAPARVGSPRDWMLLLAVGLCAAKYTRSIEALQDLRVASDETIYLRHGMRLRELGVLDGSWSPLYSVWYSLLSWLEPDPVLLYTLNYKLLVVGTSCAVFLLMRALRTHPLVAATTSLAYLVSNVPMAHPHVALFGLLLMLLTLAASVAARATGTAYLTAGLGLTALIFVRPEYLASLALLPVWLVFAALRRLEPLAAGDRIRLLAVPLLLLSLVAVFGNPATGSKQWLTFCGSYLFSHPELDPGPGRAAYPYNCIAVMPGIFGAADSVPAALLSNPVAFLGHVWRNLGTYLQLSAVLPFVTPLPFLGAGVQALAGWLELALLGAGAALVLARRDRRGLLPDTRFLALALIVGSANLLAALLYYPRSHYVSAQAVLMMVCAGRAAGAVLEGLGGRPLGARGAFLCGLLLFLLTPDHVHGWGSPLERREPELERRFDAAFASRRLLGQYWLGQPFRAPAPPLENHRPAALLEDRRTVAALRSLKLRSRVSLLAVGDYTAYLPNRHRYVPWMRWLGSPTPAFLQEQSIDVIVVGRVLLSDYAGLPGWQALLERPADFGFARLAVPGSRNLLLVRLATIES